MNILKNVLTNYSTGKNVLFLFILTNIVYAIMLVFTIPHVMNFSGGIKLLDMMPMGYDIEYIQSLFNALGDEGRLAYLVIQIRVDMIYPLLFAVSNSLLMVYLLKQINKSTSSLFYLSLIPVVAGVADYLENFGICTLIKSYPDLSQTVAETTNIFSLIKSMSTSVFFVSLIVVLIVLGTNKLLKKKSHGI